MERQLREAASITLPVQWQGIWGDVSAGAWAWAGVRRAGCGCCCSAGAAPRVEAPSRDQVLLWAGLLGFLTMYLLTPYRVWMNQESAPCLSRSAIWPDLAAGVLPGGPGLGSAQHPLGAALRADPRCGQPERELTAVEGEPQPRCAESHPTGASSGATPRPGPC